MSPNKTAIAHVKGSANATSVAENKTAVVHQANNTAHAQSKAVPHSQPNATAHAQPNKTAHAQPAKNSSSEQVWVQPSPKAAQHEKKPKAKNLVAKVRDCSVEH